MCVEGGGRVKCAVMDSKAILPYISRMTPPLSASVTVTSKGQVTFRRDLLAYLGAGPGDRLDISPLPDGGLEIRSRKRAGRLADLYGSLYDPDGPRLSLEEIDAAIAKGWAGEL